MPNSNKLCITNVGKQKIFLLSQGEISPQGGGVVENPPLTDIILPNNGFVLYVLAFTQAAQFKVSLSDKDTSDPQTGTVIAEGNVSGINKVSWKTPQGGLSLIGQESFDEEHNAFEVKVQVKIN